MYQGIQKSFPQAKNQARNSWFAESSRGADWPNFRMSLSDLPMAEEEKQSHCGGSDEHLRDI